MNRGRIQAQGNSTEKSAVWATNDDIPKSLGLSKVDNLEYQLTPAELRARTKALGQARNRIRTAPSYGVSPMRKSYYDDYRKREIRVDIEVISGVAFIDDLNNM